MKPKQRIEYLEYRLTIIDYAGKSADDFDQAEAYAEELEALYAKENSKPLRKVIPRMPVDIDILKKQEILSAVEVMSLLQIDSSTLQRWTKAGVLKKYGVQSRVYYKFSDVIKAIEQI